MTNIEIGKACSTHTAIVIYTTLLGNCQAKRPSENLEKDGKIIFQKYDVRVTWFNLSQHVVQIFL
jgi:homoserine acetyltransferase